MDQALEILEMMQRPGAMEDIKEIVQRMREDPERGGLFNATSTAFVSEDADALAADPLMRVLEDREGLARARDPEQAQELVEELQGSPLFEDLQKLGTLVLEQMRIKRLEAGAPVQLVGLQGAAELNGEVGLLTDPTAAEAEANPDRRVVELAGGDRLALRPENLALPRHAPGDAVTLEAEFDGEEEGLEGAAAVVSTLTDEERGLGFGARGGRVVVDVLPSVPGGPVLHRLLMWPELLRPRPFRPGDVVELAGLQGDAALNGRTGTVAAAEGAELEGLPASAAVVVLADGQRLAVRRGNLRLVGTAAVVIGGMG